MMQIVIRIAAETAVKYPETGMLNLTSVDHNSVVVRISDIEVLEWNDDGFVLHLRSGRAVVVESASQEGDFTVLSEIYEMIRGC